MTTYTVPSSFVPLAFKDVPDTPEIVRNRRAYQRHVERVRRQRAMAEEQRELVLDVLRAMDSVLEGR